MCGVRASPATATGQEGWRERLDVEMRSMFVATLVTLVFSVHAFAQQQCLHGPNEDAAQKARRRAGLTLVRAINTAEANEGAVKARRYLPLAELTVDLTKAQGFEVQFTTDGKDCTRSFSKTRRTRAISSSRRIKSASSSRVTRLTGAFSQLPSPQRNSVP